MASGMYRTRVSITRGLYIFTPFFTAVYIVERFIMQSGYYFMIFFSSNIFNVAYLLYCFSSFFLYVAYR